MTRRAIAVATTAAGALFVVLGSLLPLYGVESAPRYEPPGGPLPEVTRWTLLVTPWELVRTPPPPPGVDMGEFPTYGYSLVFAVMVVAVGVVMQLRTPLVAAIGRVGVLVASGLVVGTVWTALETLGDIFGGTALEEAREFVGAGTWLLLLGAAGLLAGSVVAQDWPARVPQSSGVAVYQLDDDDTPPFGIPIPVAEPGARPAGHGPQPVVAGPPPPAPAPEAPPVAR
ncbi:MAG: hypothetical protein HOV94_37745, partial [Saccharothrix sp.]|nr:hypothetical protein [Saccharothrix sp.]